ncbi:MAG: TonB-dependent receptor plug domain-containing protein, partial [Thermodesulfobacteriota bacterium]|nr:TonB-dependent receptor plug domain-containing protein [Thermodesulfobacteriota bacterium]
LLLILLLFIPQIVSADNLQTEVTVASEVLPVMPVVHVEALRIAPTTGMIIIDKEMIENLPTRNGSVNEIIGIVPGVQYSEDSLSSFTGGETTPPQVSISGGRFYENNFTIDGVSNNSPLDPALDNYRNTSKLPGHPQIFFLSPQLIEQVTIYNSNIPAEFGGFTGGQVDTETIDPEDTSWGKVNYRTTSSHWTQFHISPQNEDDFYNSNSALNQPEFKKHDGGLTLNIPLQERTGLITSYHQLYSEIPLQHLGTTNTQTRRQENFFLKLNHELDVRTNISFTALYAPTESQYFLKSAQDSGYSIEGSNYSLLFLLQKKFHIGQLRLHIDYTGQKTKRDSPENLLKWSTGTEGGSGNLSTGQKKISIKSDMDFDTIWLGITQHKIKLGLQSTYSSQSYKRPATNYYYYSSNMDNSIVCEPSNIACIDGDQYLSKRIEYVEADTNAEITDAAAYIQDSFSWKRLELYPGVRISYDNFTNNTNIAPRLSTSLDIFGNSQTILFAGKNRYYSGTLLTHALYEDIIQTYQHYDNEIDDWIDNTQQYQTVFKSSEVKTPYTDELTAGIIQKIFGGELKFQYIEKRSRDEFLRYKVDNPLPDPDTYIMANFGRSEHKSYQISWQRSWKQHFLELNGTWQETTTSNDDYSTSISEGELTETIWYKNKELYYYEIPKEDFNRPVVANLTYIGKLPYGLTFTNVIKYRGAYWKLEDTKTNRSSEIDPTQESDVYEKVKTKKSILFDWKICWAIPQFYKQQILLSLDIYNVFDHKIKYDYQSGTSGYDYELGRQIWAGLELNF